MLAMQYSIQLPLNFDAQQVQQRVSARRGLFDGRDGLVHKSFLFSERDHLYAPFYVWQDLEQAQGFLLDELFQGVSETFTRQRVRSWFVLAMEYGDRTITPGIACRESDPIPPEMRLDQFVEQEKSHQEQLVGADGLYMQLVALDADRWEIMRFGLWENEKSMRKPHGDCAQLYQVLHISEPEKA